MSASLIPYYLGTCRSPEALRPSTQYSEFLTYTHTHTHTQAQRLLSEAIEGMFSAGVEPSSSRKVRRGAQLYSLRRQNEIQLPV